MVKININKQQLSFLICFKTIFLILFLEVNHSINNMYVKLGIGVMTVKGSNNPHCTQYIHHHHNNIIE